MINSENSIFKLCFSVDTETQMNIFNKTLHTKKNTVLIYYYILVKLLYG